MTLLTAGIDVGTAAIKAVILQYDADDGHKVLAWGNERIRKRDPVKVVDDVWAKVMEDAGVTEDDVAYLASTGDGEVVKFRRGHFYGMTTHARGGLELMPEARAFVDIGALHARAMLTDERGKVLGYQMTGQCASGSGQFLENIARYLGVGLADVGAASLRAEKPERISSICAVLAETDVINMVSQGISTEDILKGIHVSIGNRMVKLLRNIKAADHIGITGGLAADEGLQAAIRERFAKLRRNVHLYSHPHSAEAGALGAAIWAGYRHLALQNGDRYHAGEGAEKAVSTHA
jgi:benzoyl-CoA reductase subunit D